MLGYHGCSTEAAQNILGGSEFLASENDYDWLGPGVYFWENDPIRAFQWASLPWRKIERPSVVGAVIDLGLCLDLTTQAGIETVQIAHRELSKLQAVTGQALPKNSGLDKGKRSLDCAVIKHLHRARAQIAVNVATMMSRSLKPTAKLRFPVAAPSPID